MSPIETESSDEFDNASLWIKSGRSANLTYRWIFAAILLGFSMVGISIFAAVQTVKLDNRVTREEVAQSLAQQVETCITTNDRRREAAVLANEAADADQTGLEIDQTALDNDRANWEAADAEFPNGIPEPLRGTIFTGLDARQKAIDGQQTAIDKRRERIVSTYQATDCSLISLVEDSSSVD